MGALFFVVKVVEGDLEVKWSLEVLNIFVVGRGYR
jgi:hypothetical protein